MSCVDFGPNVLMLLLGFVIVISFVNLWILVFTSSTYLAPFNCNCGE